MKIIIILFPLSLLLAFCGLGAYLWCILKEQYKDIDGQAHRILFEDDLSEKN